MKIYNYDPATKEFLDSTFAHESPLEPGVFLIPAHATKLEPPKAGKNQVAIFSGDQWVIAADYRKTTVYSTKDGSVVEIDEIGQLPDGVTPLPKPSSYYNWVNNAWVEDIEGKRLDVLRAIDNFKDLISNTYGVLVEGKWYQTDLASRIKYLSLNVMGANIPANYQYKTMDGTFIQMTQYLANLIISSIVINDISISQIAETHKENVNGSSTPETYDWSTGWPAGFTGSAQ